MLQLVSLMVERGWSMLEGQRGRAELKEKRRAMAGVRAVGEPKSTRRWRMETVGIRRRWVQQGVRGTREAAMRQQAWAQMLLAVLQMRWWAK